MRFVLRRARKLGVVIGICALLLIVPFASPALARGFAGREGHFGSGYGFRGSVVRVYPSYGWGWGWGGPYWYGYYPYGYYYEDTGTLKLENAVKTDEVYINGSLVGTARDNKTMHLHPGSYRVTVKHSGRDVINENVYILRGKTIKLDIGDKY
jgi:hypothetical protein